MKSTTKGSVRHHNFESNNSKFYRLRSGKVALLLLALLVFSMMLPAPAAIVSNQVLADGGDPVASFGTSGLVATDFAGGNDAANAVAATPDGKIIAAGLAAIPGKGTDFALARYDGNGILDSTFGTNGKVTTDFFGANDGARSLVVQPDGKIVLSGFATNGSERQFALARYTVSGLLDPSFGQSGKLTFDLGSTSEAYKIAQQEDGKIVIVGESRPQNSLDFTILRLNPTDGSLDTSFGNNGVVRVDFGNADRATSLAISGKKIFVVGVAVKSATDSDFAIAGLNGDGSLNNQFDDDGKVTVDFSGKQDGAQDIVIPPPTFTPRDEDLLIGGYATNETSDFAVLGLTFSGKLSNNWFKETKERVDYSGGRDIIFDLDIQPDGDLLATGWAGIGANFDVGITKWGASGRRDFSWGLQGNLTFDTASGGNNVAYDATIYQDTVVTVGQGLNPATGNDDFILTQHKNEKFAEIIKRAPSVPVMRGDIITYTFEIKNLTDKELTFTVTDLLPVGVTFDESQNTNWSILSAFGRSPILEREVSVSGGQTSFIALHVRADQSGILKNKANLLLPYPDDPIFGYVTPDFLSSSEVEHEVKEPELPEITKVTQNGKHLNVTLNSTGASQSSTIVSNAIEAQAACPLVLFDGVEQKTSLDPDNPSTTLIVKKGYKKLTPGQIVRIRVRLCSGIETADFIYTRP